MRQQAANSRPVPSRRGFTLIELLVVIGIITLLLAILVPTISSIQRSAKIANVRAQLNELSGAIDQYFNTFHAYPGPMSNDELQNGVKPTNVTGKTRVTAAENLYLGLMGGLSTVVSGNKVSFVFDTASAYKPLGPQCLSSRYANTNAAPPQYDKFLAFRPKEVTSPDSNGDGFFKDAGGIAADDTNIPEFIDRWGSEDGLPILYLRARVGVGGVMTNAGTDETTGSSARYAYDVTQYLGYVVNPIGIRPKDFADLYPKLAGNTCHGLHTVSPQVPKPTATDTPTGDHPNNYLAVFTLTIGNGSNSANVPKQKDGFILISAGPSRIYGANDNISNIGDVSQ